jgi:glycosyltransferase involved in cell wall biosynthesis
MACGLPCLATPVGGVEELVPREWLLRPESPDFLAAKLVEVLNRPDRLAEMGARNWTRARAFESSELQRRREAFFRTLFEPETEPAQEAGR